MDGQITWVNDHGKPRQHRCKRRICSATLNGHIGDEKGTPALKCVGRKALEGDIRDCDMGGWWALRRLKCATFTSKRALTEWIQKKHYLQERRQHVLHKRRPNLQPLWAVAQIEPVAMIFICAAR